MEKEGTDSGEFYTDMWKNISDMSVYINEANEVVSVRVCQTLLTFISRYSLKFRQNGITYDEQAQILQSIEKKVYQNGSITYSNNYARSIAECFDTEAVSMKLKMAYAD
jgi:hypothetical protein